MTPNPPSDRDTNQSRELTRRAALTTAGAAGAASLAGCLGFGGGNPTDTTDPTDPTGSDQGTATSATNLPAYTKWAYPMGTRDRVKSTPIYRYEPKTISANLTATGESALSSVERQMVDLTSYLGGLANKDDPDMVLVLDMNRIYEVPYSKSEMEDTVESYQDIESAGEFNGYSLYTHARFDDALAMTDGQFIVGRFLDDEDHALEKPLGVVKALIQTYTGSDDRLADTSGNFATLMEVANTGYFNYTEASNSPYSETRYDANVLGGVIMEHLTHAVEGDTTAATQRYLFKHEEDASIDAVEKYVEKSTRFASWSVEDVTQQGPRLISVTGTADFD
jgi:hypothetical protein